MSTIKRKPTAGQFAGVFGSPTPVRRDETDERTDPGADLAPEPPPAPAAEPVPAPVPRRRTAIRKPAEPEPAGLDPATRRTLDVEARRYLAARRKLDERARDLDRAVRAAQTTRPEPGEIAAVLTAAGLGSRELPADIAARIGTDRA